MPLPYIVSSFLSHHLIPTPFFPHTSYILYPDLHSLLGYKLLEGRSPHLLPFLPKDTQMDAWLSTSVPTKSTTSIGGPSGKPEKHLKLLLSYHSLYFLYLLLFFTTTNLAHCLPIFSLPRGLHSLSIISLTVISPTLTKGRLLLCTPRILKAEALSYLSFFFVKQIL